MGMETDILNHNYKRLNNRNDRELFQLFLGNQNVVQGHSFFVLFLNCHNVHPYTLGHLHNYRCHNYNVGQSNLVDRSNFLLDMQYNQVNFLHQHSGYKSRMGKGPVQMNLWDSTTQVDTVLGLLGSWGRIFRVCIQFVPLHKLLNRSNQPGKAVDVWSLADSSSQVDNEF